MALFLQQAAAQTATAPASQPAVLRSAETAGATRYELSPLDEKLLDEIQQGCFLYLWREAGKPAGLARDRYKANVASIAAVGFQLAGIPIGVRRGWISLEDGQERAKSILTALLSHSDNRKWGMYLHFPNHNTGGTNDLPWKSEFSTVDTALLLAGAMTASSFFGGDVAKLTDRMLAEANWREYLDPKIDMLKMSWHVHEGQPLTGEGEFGRGRWTHASDEERLVYFLAAAAPTPEHALTPAHYYKLTRRLGAYKGGPEFVLSWPGNLFTYVFAHCFIDYKSLPADNPGLFGIDAPAVDWFENSRRATLAHRQRCIDLADRFKTLAPDRWGLSACAARDGYIVPEVEPHLAPKEHLFEGTVAPYAAGSAIMFAPEECLAALRAFRELKGPDGKPFIWREPQDGGYGFVDSFNLDQNYACDDYVGIDQGPMLLAIENVRTGLVWRLFMQHPVAQRAVELLKLKP